MHIPMPVQLELLRIMLFRKKRKGAELFSVKTRAPYGQPYCGIFDKTTHLEHFAMYLP
jgi:hypothetical protein